MGRGAHSIQILGPLSAAAPRERAERRGAGEPALPELRPRRVGELLDTACDALRARAGACLALAVPPWILVHGLERAILTERVVAFDDPSDLGLLMGQGAVASGVRALTTALVTLVVYGYLQGRRPSASEAFAASLRRAPALLALTFLTGMGMFTASACGVVCLMLPAVLLGWLWAVAPAALVLEGVGPLAALRRSAALARRGFARWLGITTVSTLASLPLLGVIQVLQIPEAREELRASLGCPEPWFTGLELLLSSALSGAMAALSAVMLTVYYIDQRVRVEGFDLDMRLERLRRRPPRRAGG
jgi:hypothetical protein